MYKRSATSRNTIKHGRGRPSLAALRARRQAASFAGQDDMAHDDDELDNENDETGDDRDNKMDVDFQPINSDEDDVDDDDDDDNIDDVLGNNVSDTDDDGFGELVADLVGTEGGRSERSSRKPDSKVRKSLYMTEKRLGKDVRLERKDKGKIRYTAYSLWAREYRKTSNFSKEVDFTTARRELWANVSNKEKNNWRRKAKIQATKAKALEKAGIGRDNKKNTVAVTNSNTFINRPTTSRTKKLQLQAEEKQKARDDIADAKATTSTPKRTRNNSYNRRSATPGKHNATNNSLGLYNGSNSTYNNITNNYESKEELPTIEPIDAAAHLKLLGESLSIMGEHLKDHDGQIALSGSLSILLDSLLSALGPLLCLTTRLPGLDQKPKLKENLAITLDNIAYVMPGL